MTPFQRSLLVGGLLLAGAGLSLPRAYAAANCTNEFLTGTYNAEISSLSFMNVLSTLNSAANVGGTGTGTTGTGTTGATGTTGTGTTGTGATGIGTGVSTGGGATGSTGIGTTGTGTTGSTGTTGTGTTGAGGTTGAAANPGGFGNNRFSLSGAVPGSGRFYFDGAGNIWGVDPNTAKAPVPQNMVIGSYNVNADCSATMTLTSGEHFSAVVADSGADVLFMQSDANAGGAIGQLTRALNSCLNAGAFPQNFAFNLFGAQPVTTTTTGTTGTGTTGTGTTGAVSTPSFAPYAAVGEVQLASDNTFTIKEWIYTGGKTQAVTAHGAYTVGSDCRLQLTFAPSSNVSGGTTGSVTFSAPLTFQATLNREANGRNTAATTGVLVVQPQNVSTVVGTFIAQ